MLKNLDENDQTTKIAKKQRNQSLACFFKQKLAVYKENLGGKKIKQQEI